MNGENTLEQANWREPRLYSGYLKDVQRFYEREPVVQISVQLILSVFTVIFFTFFAIRPTLATISTLIKKIEDLESVSVRLDTKIQELTRAQSILAENGVLLENVSKTTIPVEPEIDKLNKIMELLANETGAYFISVDFQPTPLTDAGREATRSGGLANNQREKFITFSFTVGGTQEQIINFLDGLERVERAVLLTKVTFIEPELNYKKVFPLAASGRATVYYLPETN